MTAKTVELGSFNILAGPKGKGMMRVSDPSYNQDDCPHQCFEVAPGRWLASVRITENPPMVESLIVRHESLAGLGVIPREPVKFQIGVDTGSAGFYDDTRYLEVRNNFTEIQEGTLNENESSIFEYGVVAATTDGVHDVLINRSPKGIIDAAMLVFIREDESVTGFDSEVDDT